MSTEIDTSAATAPTVERAFTLGALDRTLQLELVSGSGANARVKVSALEEVLPGEITVAAGNACLQLRIAGRSAFSLTPKGAERVQAWLSQLQRAQGVQL
jgi:hypothetical protein